MCNICLNICTCVAGEWKLFSFVIFCFRKAMLLELCFVSMLTIKLRFVTLFLNKNYDVMVFLSSSYIDS